MTWDANIYSEFLDLRTRPAKDLLAAIPMQFNPKVVYDLGCGPGNSTILLKQRWPVAKVIGVDNSENMLLAAKQKYAEIEFHYADIAAFSPAAKVDCVFANASLQWLGEHDKLFPKLLNFVNPQGFLAIQMPNNFHTPGHQRTLEILEANTKWQPLLKKLRYGKLNKPFYDLKFYYDLLIDKVNYLQLWETTYFQELRDHQAIFNWVSGTALSAILPAMTEADCVEFAVQYVKAIAKDYPLQANTKVILPFTRMFIVAQAI